MPSVARKRVQATKDLRTKSPRAAASKQLSGRQIQYFVDLMYKIGDENERQLYSESGKSLGARHFARMVQRDYKYVYPDLIAMEMLNLISRKRASKGKRDDIRLSSLGKQLVDYKLQVDSLVKEYSEIRKELATIFPVNVYELIEPRGCNRKQIDFKLRSLGIKENETRAYKRFSHSIRELITHLLKILVSRILTQSLQVSAALQEKKVSRLKMEIYQKLSSSILADTLQKVTALITESNSGSSESSSQNEEALLNEIDSSIIYSIMDFIDEAIRREDTKAFVVKLQLPSLFNRLLSATYPVLNKSANLSDHIQADILSRMVRKQSQEPGDPLGIYTNLIALAKLDFPNLVFPDNSKYYNVIPVTSDEIKTAYRYTPEIYCEDKSDLFMQRVEEIREKRLAPGFKKQILNW